MNMNRLHRLLPAVVAIFALLVLGDAAVASAKANHHDAKQLLGDNLKHDGHHDIDHKGKYTTSVEVSHGKIAAVPFKHSEKGNIPVKKYKTHKKMAQAARGHIVYASFVLAQMEDMGTVYIGYSYVDDDGNEEIYWFPAEMIVDGDTGAVEYVPTS
jgi:major membrane immunogen (membrane-anchored lipoprotein)